MRSLATLAALVLVGCAAAPARPAAFGTDKQTRPHTCTVATDCSVVPRSCCGSCGTAASGDARAVLTESWHGSSRCSGVSCPRCHAEPDPALVAYCAAGTCRALDLHTSAMTRCTADSDCIVRPRGCCDCAASAWVAVRADQSTAYQSRVCRPAIACPQCVGDPPPLRAVCGEGHCALAATGADPVGDLEL